MFSDSISVPFLLSYESSLDFSSVKKYIYTESDEILGVMAVQSQGDLAERTMTPPSTPKKSFLDSN